MALFFELIPIVAFFISYRWSNLYIATIAMMVVSLLHLIVNLLQKEPIPIERWLSTIIFIILGSITLISKNDYFIKLKPTIGYAMFATVLKWTAYYRDKTLPEANLDTLFHLPKKAWLQLNNAWIVFLCSLGTLNLIIVHTTTTDTWVYFKVLGTPALFLVFLIAQITYLSYYKKIESFHDKPIQR